MRGCALVIALAVTGCSALRSQDSTEPVREQLQAAAEQGDVSAQYRLARAYCCGLGLSTSTRQSLYWYCRAAIQGHTPAQYELGNILSNFANDPDRASAFSAPDYVSAYMWYTVASLNGHQLALDARDNIAQSMSNDDIMRAKRWATRWTQIHCDNLR